MFDTHCHLTFPEFAGRTGEILAAAAESGVRGAITVATTTDDSIRSRELALAHDRLWHSAGVHPLYSDQPIDWHQLRDAATSQKCVAWGELGLDRHYSHPDAQMQSRILDAQLQFIESARQEDAQFDKPLILHCREAFKELIAVLKSTSLNPSRMVFHCFTGTQADARMVLDFGAWLSFTGVATFKGAHEVAAAAAMAPADRIMVETDSPFLTPEPHRKVRPNEPKMVVHVARKLAEIRGIVGPDAGDFERLLDDNAKRFFNINF